MIMSGQFISLPWFSSHCSKTSEWWTKRCRTTDQLQLSSTQADRSLTRHFQRNPPYPSYQSCLASTLKTSCLHLLVIPSTRWSLCPPPVMKGNERPTDNFKLHNFKLYDSRLHCLYLPICLPMIQSVIIRCRIPMSP